MECSCVNRPLKHQYTLIEQSVNCKVGRDALILLADGVIGRQSKEQNAGAFLSKICLISYNSYV